MKWPALGWVKDGLVLAAMTLVLLTAGLLALVTYTNVPTSRPLLSVFIYSLVPVLFMVGAVIFYLALRHGGARGRGKYPVVDFNQPRQRRRIGFFLAAGVVELALLTVGGYQTLEFTDTPDFCGNLCHSVMQPEYVTHQVSPHARVSCAKCHVGPGGSWLVKSKVQGLPLIVAALFHTYSRPISTPVENLRPARETCEQCHWPQKFSEDRLRIYQHFLPDEENTQETQLLAFKVGGGEPGRARDIHWHVASKVWYLPLDEKRQEIGWAGVEREDGQITEYFDPGRADEATPQRIESGKRLMDCMDCHNRATHVFRSPDELLDEALAFGRIDPSLPFIKKLGLEALTSENPNLEAVRARIHRIPAFYALNYPRVSVEKEAAIAQAMAKLEKLAQYTIFPGMRVNWQTHTNFLSHDGCFRCHGKLSTLPLEGKGEVIDAECTSCHYEVPPKLAGVAIGQAPPLWQARPPDITHPLEGWGDCLVCHGPLGFKPFLPDHVGRPTDTCTVCHGVRR